MGSSSTDTTAAQRTDALAAALIETTRPVKDAAD